MPCILNVIRTHVFDVALLPCICSDVFLSSASSPAGAQPMLGLRDATRDSYAGQPRQNANLDLGVDLEAYAWGIDRAGSLRCTFSHASKTHATPCRALGFAREACSSPSPGAPWRAPRAQVLPRAHEQRRLRRARDLHAAARVPCASRRAGCGKAFFMRSRLQRKCCLPGTPRTLPDEFSGTRRVVPTCEVVRHGTHPDPETH